MKNTILPLVLLVLFTGSSFAQATCDLSIENSPMIGKFKLGMTTAKALEVFPAMTVQNYEESSATASFLMGDKGYSINFEDDEIRSICVSYPEGTSSNIDNFAALISRDLRLADVWIPSAAINQDDRSLAQDGRLLQCRDFGVLISILGKKRTPYVFVRVGQL